MTDVVFHTATAPDRLRLASDEVHSWCVSLDLSQEASADFYEILSSDERERSARLRFERDRRRFIVARGVLRELLGLYLVIHPAEVRFAYNAFGKPALSPEFGSGLKFNLSHAGDLALVAITPDAEIGVDLEYIRAPSDHAAIARHFFSPAEVDHLNGLPSHLRALAFFKCWTKKEAYVKAHGEGLSIPLTSFTVPLTTDPADRSVDLPGPSGDGGSPRPWSFYTLRPAPGYIGALAVEGDGWRLTQRHWRMLP